MPAQWTGKVVGEIHNNRLTCKELAKELGWHEKYLSQVLNGHRAPNNAEATVTAALERLIARKKENV